MTVVDQIIDLALQGIGRLNAEATIGRRMTAAELRHRELLDALARRDATYAKIDVRVRTRVKNNVLVESRGVVPSAARPPSHASCASPLAAAFRR